MAIASGLPKPRIWIVPDDDPNAFATGRDAATASIAVTEGLLRTLSPRRAAGRRRPRDGAHPEPRRAAHDAAGRDGGRDRADVGRDGADDTGWRATWAAAAIGGGGRERGAVAGGRQPARARHSGALAADAGRGADRLAHPGHGGEPEARVSWPTRRARSSPATRWRWPRRWRSSTPRSAPTRAITRGAAHLCIVDPAPGLFSTGRASWPTCWPRIRRSASGSSGSRGWPIGRLRARSQPDHLRRKTSPGSKGS